MSSPWLPRGMLKVTRGTAAELESRSVDAACHQPTRINCAPSADRAREDAVSNESQRTVIIGGEPINASLVADCSAQGLTLVDSHGPTECADVAVGHLSRPQTAPAAGLTSMPARCRPA